MMPATRSGRSAPSSKTNPRQRMIGMMYLVLTAMLALNVSKDVLNAFVVVNNSLEKSMESLNGRTTKLYADFDLARSVDPLRITGEWEKAQEAKRSAEALIAEIGALKKKLIMLTENLSESEADTIKLASVVKKDDYDIPTYILIGEKEDASMGEARKLKDKLNACREKLTALLPEKDRGRIDLGINTPMPGKENHENWELYNFYHTPLAASITILSKLQNDVKNAETAVVDYLLKKNDVEVLRFDTIIPKVIPESNYVLLGEEYKADVFLAAFNKTMEPVIYSGNSNRVKVEQGVGKYVYKTSKEGIVKWGGSISFTTPQGKKISYPYSSEFIVARPTLTVSADKMNVLYSGVENPISVSVPGIPNERISVAISSGAIRPLGNGKYEVTRVSGTKAHVAVTALLENGEKRDMGSIEFRVKPLPRPYAKFGEVTGRGQLSRSLLKSLRGIIAEYDKNFDFDIRCKIIEFKMDIARNNIIGKEMVSSSNALTGEMADALSNTRPGDKVYIYGIRGQNPDGRAYTLNEITVEVK